MKEFEKFDRIGTMPHRSYYIPFAPEDVVGTKLGIVDRTTSSRFTSLDGVWQIKGHNHVDDFDIGEELTESIPVPACVQMHGYDHIQYINTRYPFPVMLPHIPYENPCWHYRRTFHLHKNGNEKYYINFEGVDSSFYLYINGQFKGYSQISHATSEFDITDLAVNGETQSMFSCSSGAYPHIWNVRTSSVFPVYSEMFICSRVQKSILRIIK